MSDIRWPVVEPWQPKVGEYVLVERGPECRAWHSMRGEPVRAYGRVEMIDRTYDVPDLWVANVEEVGNGYTEDEAREDAAKHRGHYYLVQDALDSGRVTNLDGYYCAFELTLADPLVAIREITLARIKHATVPAGERLYRALMGAAR